MYNLEWSIFTSDYFPFLQIEKYPDFEGVIINFSNSLINCLDNLEQENFDEKYRAFQGAIFDKNGDYTTAYINYIVNKAVYYLKNQPILSDDKGISEKCTDSYKGYIEAKLDYYIPLVRFKFSFWFTVNFGASCLLRIHNGEIVSVMKQHCGGGGFVRSPYEWNETEGNYYVRHNFLISQDFEEHDWSFPIDSKFSCVGTGNKITAICDNNQDKIADLEALGLNIGEYFEVAYNLRAYYDHKDKQSEILAQALGKDIREFDNSYIELPAPQYRLSNKIGVNYESSAIDTVQNKLQPNAGYEFNEKTFEKYCKNLQNKSDYFLMDGFFDRESDDGFFRFNPAITKLSDGNYLFGVHDGELFVGKNGVWEKIGDKLKNFRLCKLKNLNRSKRE